MDSPLQALAIVASTVPMTFIATYDWSFAKRGRIFDHIVAHVTRRNDQGHDMKYATATSPAPALHATSHTTANTASFARTALSAVAAMARTLVAGYIEGRRLQAEVMARRGYPYGCD